MQLSRRRSSAILGELRDRFENGDKLTVEKIVQEFIGPNTSLGYLLMKSKVRGWMQQLKQYYRSEKKWTFKCLNDLGEYGLAETEGEYRYISTVGFRLVKGITSNVNFSMEEAQKKGLLIPAEEEIRVLKAPNGDISKTASASTKTKEPKKH